jgi:ADP-ribosyl-[dinitrogen reductase] hydrolase
MSALDRAIGALLGLATGDAVGTTLEFEPPGSFTPIDDLIGGGPFGLQPGQWTDDTSMALCLAESILDTGAVDLSDQLRRYLLWRDHGYLSSTGRCFDIGSTTTSQLDRFRRTGQPVDPHFTQEAAANGSLMRLAAVPVRWFGDIEEAARQSGQSSRSTHPADRPVDACRLLGAMVAALIAGDTFELVTSPQFWKWGDLHPLVAALAAGEWKGKEPPAIKGTGYCIDALEAALWAVNGAGDFGQAVLRAANLGNDADTTAAIAGQLAGARWGASGIPPSWREKIVDRERIESLARGLHAAGGGQGGGDGWHYDEVVHAWWASAGQVLAGEYPGHRDPARRETKINLLVDAGIRTFVDLTTPPDGLIPYEPTLAQVGQRRGLDLRRISYPIPDVSVIADEHHPDITDAIENSLARGGVYVHCWGGVGRTGTVIGCLLADQGLSYEQVLGRLAELRSGTRKAHRPVPETDAQRQVIRRRGGRSSGAL